MQLAACADSMGNHPVCTYRMHEYGFKCASVLVHAHILVIIPVCRYMYMYK